MVGKRDLTRRRFLQRTAVAAAGAGLAGRSFLLDGGPLAASPIAGASAQVAPAAPSDTVRFGMIGVGMRGSDLLETSISLPGVECAAACDLYEGRRTLARQILAKDSVPITARYQELLDNKEIDCIVAAVPDHWHKQIIVDACAAGKDIYCEKPMTHAVAEGFEIIAAAGRSNRIVQIGSQEPSSVVYAKAKELLASGAIGKLCLVEATMGRNDHCGAWWYSVPPDLSPQTVDWETWLGTAPKRPFDGSRWTRWRCFKDYGEGIPGDLCIHHLTGIHYVLGIAAPPKRAFTQGGLYRWHDGRDVPDVMTTVYDYGDFSCTLRVTLNTETESGFRFMGDRGILEIHGVEDPEALSVTPQDGADHDACTPAWPMGAMRQEYVHAWRAEHGPRPGSQQVTEAVTYHAPPLYDDTRDHLFNFFQSVKTRRPSVEDEHFGNNAAIAIHMANESYYKGGAAVWDASARQIRT
ncbi:MAG TPA: Gfo/Idh/MocA family oxidoreductase [Terriglobia bacterium]|jgi:predicted dehydrogenase|nr:Gfo/Idh/MocA family oxidoreductase [Terriglobia bacterium]